MLACASGGAKEGLASSQRLAHQASMHNDHELDSFLLCHERARQHLRHQVPCFASLMKRGGSVHKVELIHVCSELCQEACDRAVARGAGRFCQQNLDKAGQAQANTLRNEQEQRSKQVKQALTRKRGTRKARPLKIDRRSRTCCLPFTSPTWMSRITRKYFLSPGPASK